MKIRRRDHRMPELQMAAMPDLIFTILFFFMIATHMRDNILQVKYTEPTGVGLQKVTNKATVVDVYVGKSPETGEYMVQVNRNVVPTDALAETLRRERGNIPASQQDCPCASLQADRATPMAIINEVKLALREAGILKINYSGTEKNEAISKPARPHTH